MSNNKQANKNKGVVAVFDTVMGKIRHFFADTVSEMGRCSWPSRSELLESTVLVVVAIIMLGVFVAIVDFVARYLINLITTGNL